jgi:uncharacterized protein (DUF2141 family)
MYKYLLFISFLGFGVSNVKAQSTSSQGDLVLETGEFRNTNGHLLIALLGDLVLEIGEFRNTNGHLLISLYNTEKDFPENRKASFRTIKVKASEAKGPIVFRGLPYGEYALVFLHDENDNENMDKNMVGMPLEGYGASNNAVNTFSAPKYQESKIQLSQAIVKQKLKIYY